MVNKTQIKNLLCVLHALEGTRLYTTTFDGTAVAYLTNKQIKESVDRLHNQHLSHQHITYLCEKLHKMRLLIIGRPRLCRVYWRH